MRFGSLLLLVLLPVLAIGADKPKAGKPAPPPAIAKLTWLAGTWHLEKAGRVVDEQWMAPAAGVMLGMSRTLGKGRVTEQEFRQIREGPGGELFFVVQAAGRKEAAFQIKTLTETSAVFENTLQDFPQRITYALQPDGSLSETLEGPSPTGEPKRIDSVLQRVSR